MTGIEVFLLLIGWGVAGASPGPATLTIATSAMASGRRAGILTGTGVWAGSAIWGIAAMAWMGTLMLSSAWIAEALRYAGAAYLVFLAAKSLRSALSRVALAPAQVAATGPAHFRRGFLVHLTNPKAILSWGAIFAIVVPPGAPPGVALSVLAALSVVSAVVFLGYGALFSSAGVIRRYTAARRWFDGCFALLFGAAGLKILMARPV